MDQWMKLFLDSKSNKALRIFVESWALMVLHLVMVHSNLLFVVANYS